MCVCVCVCLCVCACVRARVYTAPKNVTGWRVLHAIRLSVKVVSKNNFPFLKLVIKNAQQNKNSPSLYDKLAQWLSTWGTRTSGSMRRHRSRDVRTSYVKLKTRFRVRQRRTGRKNIDYQAITTLIIDKRFNHIILLCKNTFVSLLICIWYYH
jgi:hypothetical protein